MVGWVDVYQPDVMDWLLCSFGRDHIHVGSAVAFTLELDSATNESKEGMVLAHANIVARVPLGTPLAADDITRHDDFVAELLNAEALGF